MRTALFLLGTCAFAQPPAFEAATIKPSKSQPGRSASHTRTGRLSSPAKP
jgi:hypothetical protein